MGAGRDGAPDVSVVPDLAAVRVLFDLLVLHQHRADVTAFGRVDRIEVADPLAVFGILAVRDIDDVPDDDRRADHFIAGLRPHRVLRVEIELPEPFAGLDVETADVAVTLSDDDLHGVADLRHGR